MTDTAYSVAVIILAAVLNALIVTSVCGVALLIRSRLADHVGALGLMFATSTVITLSGFVVANGVQTTGDTLSRRMARVRRRRRADE